jgi:hypothetical protein
LNMKMTLLPDTRAVSRAATPWRITTSSTCRWEGTGTGRQVWVGWVQAAAAHHHLQHCLQHLRRHPLPAPGETNHRK